MSVSSLRRVVTVPPVAIHMEVIYVTVRKVTRVSTVKRYVYSFSLADTLV